MNLKKYLLRQYILSNINQNVSEEKDELAAHYEQFGEKWEETHNIDKELKSKLDLGNKTSNLGLMTVFNVNNDHYVIKLAGGLNGNGKWHNYLRDLQKVIDATNGYIIKLDTDVPDDVWHVYIGIKDKDNE